MIKLVSINEIDQVMKIINDAKSLLKRNSLQWQQGYPNLETMTNDINNHHLYGYIFFLTLYLHHLRFFHQN